MRLEDDEGIRVSRDQQRAAELHTEVPVVVMSAHANITTQRGRLAARMYLEKPIEIETLLGALSTLGQ
jgi:FixJ family two-component response regulator